MKTLDLNLNFCFPEPSKTLCEGRRAAEIDSCCKSSAETMQGLRQSRFLPRAQHEVQRWANGLGVTREIAADRSTTGASTVSASASAPTTAATAVSVSEAPFRWRISIADLSPPGGPFSIIPSVDRVLTLLEGKASIGPLGFNPLTSLRIHEPHGPFPGDEPTDSHVPIDSVDLNVMWCRHTMSAEVRVLTSAQSPLAAEQDYMYQQSSLAAAPGGTSFIVALEDNVTVWCGDDGVHGAEGGDGRESMALDYLDALQWGTAAHEGEEDGNDGADGVGGVIDGIKGKVLAVQFTALGHSSV